MLLDNFYVDAEVSYDGHAFSMGAYATDVVEKLWPTNYGQRGGIYLSEGGGGQRNPYGNLSAPPQGYIWDMATRAEASASAATASSSDRDDKTGKVEASVPGLEGPLQPDYPPYDVDIPDNTRVDVWLEEFRAVRGERRPAAAEHHPPRQRSHRRHARRGADAARDDRRERPRARPPGRRDHRTAATGRSRRSSCSKTTRRTGRTTWTRTARRRWSISPFTQARGVVDSTLYTTSGVLRTMELILGLPPMSQYDAAATPMYSAFQPTSGHRRRSRLAAPRVPLDEINAPERLGAEASLRDEPRRGRHARPELELNEIIWRSVRGADSPMPPPRRAAFVAQPAGRPGGTRAARASGERERERER